MKSRAYVLMKLRSFGIDASLDEVITSSYATAYYLMNQPDPGDVYVIGEDGIYDEIEAAGMRCYGKEDEVEMSLRALQDMNRTIRTVVVGLDRKVNYVKICRAASYIRDYGCSFIVTNTDASYVYPGDIIAGDSGCIVAAVEVAAGRKPDCIVGKPSHVIIDLIRFRNPGVDESEMMMIGDRLDTDILFARRNGLRSLLVLTGVTSEEELMESDEDMLPDYYTDSIRDVSTLFGIRCYVK